MLIGGIFLVLYGLDVMIIKLNFGRWKYKYEKISMFLFLGVWNFNKRIYYYIFVI